MSATNQTTNLHLPLFVGSDKPAWLVDFNGAMNSIDTAVGTNTVDISGLDAQVTAMGGTVSTLNTTVTDHTASIIALNTATSHNAGDISTINSLIGNGTPTTSDKTLIGAINELDAKDGNLSDLVTTAKTSLVAAINEAAQGSGATPAASSVTYNNSTSHLSANNVQAAIDELAQGGGGGTTISTATINGTTDADGRVTTSVSTTSVDIIGAFETSAGIMVLPIVNTADNTYKFQLMGLSSSEGIIRPGAGVSVTIKYFYKSAT